MILCEDQEGECKDYNFPKSWNVRIDQKEVQALACMRSILISLIYVVLTNILVSSFDFPPTTSSLSSSIIVSLIYVCIK